MNIFISIAKHTFYTYKMRTHILILRDRGTHTHKHTRTHTNIATYIFMIYATYIYNVRKCIRIIVYAYINRTNT